MTEPTEQNSNDHHDLIEKIGHPKGTLAVLALYMLLFVVGWVGLYFFLFLARGATSF